MTRGRPILRSELVDHLGGSEDARRKMKIILQSVTGELDIETARIQVGVTKRTFHKLRVRAMQAALDSLEPQQRGRPRTNPQDNEELDRLKKEIEILKHTAHTSQVRQEIALLLPTIMKTKTELEPSKKKRNNGQQ